MQCSNLHSANVLNHFFIISLPDCRALEHASMFIRPSTKGDKVAICAGRDWKNTVLSCFNFDRMDYDELLQHNPEINPLNVGHNILLWWIHLNNMVQCQMRPSNSGFLTHQTWPRPNVDSRMTESMHVHLFQFLNLHSHCLQMFYRRIWQKRPRQALRWK